jgi:hypothetical protein
MRSETTPQHLRATGLDKGLTVPETHQRAPPHATQPPTPEATHPTWIRAGRTPLKGERRPPTKPQLSRVGGSCIHDCHSEVMEHANPTDKRPSQLTAAILLAKLLRSTRSVVFLSQFLEVYFYHCPREANKASHVLASR